MVYFMSFILSNLQMSNISNALVSTNKKLVDDMLLFFIIYNDKT